MLTSLGLLFLAVLATGGIVAAGWWAMNEGFRQGDYPGDVGIELDWGDGLMRLRLVNPAAAAAVVAVRGHWVQNVLLAQPGRTTVRRRDVIDADTITAVGAHSAGVLRWVPPPVAGRQLVVDVAAWQSGARIRRHRFVLSAPARPLPA